MGYADYLRGLLRPLGVYELSAGSFSGGAAEALGAALDQAWEAMQKGQRETLVPTAEGDGLAGYERLFGILPESRDIAGRRAAVAALLAVGGESFSAAALSRSLAACGVEAAVRETDAAGTVVVSFPGCMGKPDGFARMAEIIERLLPCHLAVEYYFQYTLWRALAALTWGQAGQMTWGELMVYTGD